MTEKVLNARKGEEVIKKASTLFLAVWLIVGGAKPTLALEPRQVLVLANMKIASSITLAGYYMKRRGIPGENLVQVWTTKEESCSREEYESKVAGPVRAYLKKRDPDRQIKCLVVMYGLPLKVRPRKLSAELAEFIEELEKRRTALEAELKSVNTEKAAALAEERNAGRPHCDFRKGE